MEPRASGEGVGERGWVGGPYLKRASVRESQDFFRRNKETIVWKRSLRKIWQRPLNAEKLYGLTSRLIPWVALKITLKVTPSQYTQVPMYSLVFLFRNVEVDVPYLTSLDCHCDLSRRLSPNILWCVLIDQLILILGCNRLNGYGKFVRSTPPPGHVMVSGGGSPTGVCVSVHAALSKSIPFCGPFSDC